MYHATKVQTFSISPRLFRKFSDLWFRVPCPSGHAVGHIVTMSLAGKQTGSQTRRQETKPWRWYPITCDSRTWRKNTTDRRKWKGSISLWPAKNAHYTNDARSAHWRNARMRSNSRNYQTLHNCPKGHNPEGLFIELQINILMLAFKGIKRKVSRMRAHCGCGRYSTKTKNSIK